MRNLKKFGGAKAAAAPKWKPDWDWVADVKDPKDITPELRRRAAGLADVPPCPLPTVRWASRQPSTNGASSSTSSKQNGVIDVDDDEGEGSSAVSIVSPKSNGPACTAKRCKSSPRCYNNLGFEKVSVLWCAFELTSSGRRKMPRRSTLRTMRAKSSSSATDLPDCVTMALRAM